MRRLAAVLALLLGLAGAARGEEPPVIRHTLDNGLRVLVREEAGAGVVAVSLLVRGGSGLEDLATAGLTNFLHRVMVRGTTRRSAAELAVAAEQLGGTLEASADVDVAEIRGVALARHWEALLDLVAEVALAPALAAEEIERERRLLLAQMQTRLDTPFPFAFDTLLGHLFGGHPYGLPRLGLREVVARTGREALLSHYRALYRGDRLVLAVSGGVQGAAVVHAVERRFGRLPDGGSPLVEAVATATPSGQRHLVERPAQQAHVLMGWLGPGLGDPDLAAVQVLAAVLGGGTSGRLFTELRDRQGLAYSVGVVTPPRRGPGMIVAYLATAAETADTAEAALHRQVERIRGEGASEAEVARARGYQLGRLSLDRRTNARHAWFLAYHELLGVGWDFPDRHRQALAAVTPADVTAAARRYLGRPTTVVLRPR